MQSTEAYKNKTAYWLYHNYLIHCCLYYIHGESVISDIEFDNLCCELESRWDDEIESNRDYFHLLDLDSLKAGTGFTLKEEDYPTVVRCICNKEVSMMKYGMSYLEQLDRKMEANND